MDFNDVFDTLEKRDTIYIYGLISLSTNSVFYIGATINPYSRRATHKNNWGKDDTELIILDTSPISEAGFWEQFYTDLYRSYGFDIKKCIVPYHEKLLTKERLSFYERNAGRCSSISRKIDGKDIHYYRREVFKHFNFHQHISHLG